MTTATGNPAAEPRFLSARWLAGFVVVAMVLTGVTTWLVVGMAHVGRPHNAAGTVVDTTQGITPAQSAVVTLPWGTLALGVTAPRALLPKDVAESGADGVRRPPDGGRFVGLAWTARTGRGFRDLTGVSSINTHVSLITRGHTYPLDTPSSARRFCATGCVGRYSTNEAWAAVPGDASDLTIGVEYDGVTQMVDARTGVVISRGLAAPLYVATDPRVRSCAGPNWQRGVSSYDIGCSAIVQRLPWVSGYGWAATGRVWTAVYVQLERPYTIKAKDGDRYEIAENLTTYAGSLPGSVPAPRPARGSSPRPLAPIAGDRTLPAGSTMVFSSPSDDIYSTPTLAITARYALEATDRHNTTPLAYATATWSVAT